jgi:hypothetical protein
VSRRSGQLILWDLSPLISTSAVTIGCPVGADRLVTPVHCAWQPWFAAVRGFAQQWAVESPPPSDGASCFAQERSSPDQIGAHLVQLRTERNHV